MKLLIMEKRFFIDSENRRIKNITRRYFKYKYDLEVTKLEAKSLGRMYSVGKTAKLYFNHLFV